MPQAGLEGGKTIQQSPQYTALGEYLSQSKSLEDAIHSFCHPVENEFQSTGNLDEIQEHLNVSWKAIISHAAQTSFKDAKQQKLVDLVLGLRNRAAPQKDSQSCQVEGMTVWQDLPAFGWAVRDAWNFAPSDDSDQQSNDKWINVNAFTAALLGSVYSRTQDDLGLSLFCIWTARQALESTESVSNVAIAAAAAWFVYAAPTIAKLSTSGKSFDGKVAKPGPAFNEEGWTGFSQDRWNAWERTFNDVQGQISDKTAEELVEQARKAISAEA